MRSIGFTRIFELMNTPQKPEIEAPIPGIRFQRMADPRQLHQSLSGVDMSASLRTAVRAATWFELVDEFNAFTDAWLDSGCGEPGKLWHKCVLSQHIATGEALLFTIAQIGLPEGVKFRAEDVQATVEMLETRKRCIHGRPLPKMLIDDIETALNAA